MTAKRFTPEEDAIIIKALEGKKTGIDAILNELDKELLYHSKSSIRSRWYGYLRDQTIVTDTVESSEVYDVPWYKKLFNFLFK